MSLSELFAKYGADKNTTHSYAPLYEELLCDRRASLRYLLELGVGGGESLFAWRDYFPNATIIGIGSDQRAMIHGEDRIATSFGSHKSRSDLVLLAGGEPIIYDVIIDDGCHDVAAQLTSLFFLYPYLRPGGLYIIEDVQDPEDWAGLPLLSNSMLIDRRSVKDRYDDVLVVLRKPFE